jgi:hypothetical protein
MITARGMTILPDGMDDGRVVIIKACSELRLTRELQTAAAFALQTSRELILSVPSGCRIHDALLQFLKSNQATIARYGG